MNLIIIILRGGGNSNFDVKVKQIKLFDFYIKGEISNFKTTLLRMYFYVIAKGNFKIYYVKDDENVIHTSYVVGKCMKFDFLGKNDIQIGPCYTSVEHRGKGIYKSVLNYINSQECKMPGKAYMMVSENNIPSIKGIEGAGFKKVGHIICNKILKTYKRKK